MPWLQQNPSWSMSLNVYVPGGTHFCMVLVSYAPTSLLDWSITLPPFLVSMTFVSFPYLSTLNWILTLEQPFLAELVMALAEDCGLGAGAAAGRLWLLLLLPPPPPLPPLCTVKVCDLVFHLELHELGLVNFFFPARYILYSPPHVMPLPSTVLATKR